MTGARARTVRNVASAFAALAVLLSAAAAAHPDVLVVDGTLTLAPGAVASYPLAIHYHRMVGRYSVRDAGGGDLEVGLVDEATYRSDAASPAGAEAILARMGSGEGAFQQLVPCCHGTAYTPYRLLVRNQGAEPAVVDLRAWAIHDEFAVVAHRAETGAATIPGAIFLTLVVATGRAVVRARTRGARGTRTKQDAPVAGPPPSLRWSAGLFVAACTAAVALGAAGAVRYGAGPVDGMVAILADLDLPGGPFGSRAALAMGLLLLAWVASIALWIRAIEVAPHGHVASIARLGTALGAVTIVGAAAVAWTYDRWGVAVSLALLLGVPILVSATLLRLPTRSAFAPEAVPEPRRPAE